MDLHFNDFLEKYDLIGVLTAIAKDTLSVTIDHNQWLLHRKPVIEDGIIDFYRCTIDLPSDHVKRRIVSKLREDPKTRLVLDEENVSLLGELYEKDTFKKLLLRGKSFKLIPYDKRCSAS